MTVYTCTLGDLTQRLAVVDLDSDDGVARAIGLLPASILAVYTDVPWDPGIATAFRTKIGLAPCRDFRALMRHLIQVYDACIIRGATDILIEHSASETSHGPFLAEAEKALLGSLPMRRISTVYGSPKRPALLFHFGHRPLSWTPQGLSGPSLVETSLRGVGGLAAGEWVVDPCIGQGMTSRVAHKLGLNCFGTELGPMRLAKTVAWLRKKGYSVEESES